MIDTSPDNFKIFIHIQKTGGISLQRILRNKWNPLHKRLLRKLKRNHDGLLPFSNYVKQDKYYMGHNCFGIHKYLPAPFEYLTFVREPVSRIISLYKYSNKNEHAYYHHYAKGKTLEEFALDCPLMELDNGQLRFILGDSKDTFINRTPVGNLSENHLKNAIHNIENYYSFIGITEEYDASLIMMSEMFRWTPPYYFSLNQSKNISNKRTLSNDIINQISLKNHLDIKLYEFVITKFNKLRITLGISDNIIHEFIEQNVNYNNKYLTLYQKYDKLKAYLSGKKDRPIL